MRISLVKVLVLISMLCVLSGCKNGSESNPGYKKEYEHLQSRLALAEKAHDDANGHWQERDTFEKGRGSNADKWPSGDFDAYIQENAGPTTRNLEKRVRPFGATPPSPVTSANTTTRWGIKSEKGGSSTTFQWSKENEMFPTTPQNQPAPASWFFIARIS